MALTRATADVINWATLPRLFISHLGRRWVIKYAIRSAPNGPFSYKIPTSPQIGTKDRAPMSKPTAKDVAAKERHLPPMFQVGDIIAPKAPQTIAEARLEEGTLTDLCLKLAHSINRFT